eukprot:gnl/Spiro4/21341_TR10421_c0_g4_i1.p1 gnl/Spiro4/21341_TR10421_c0_g4~~gnl/Spiro4/21341_TR10421_c0_g4_i1.p1  ORF type:complete len:554 (-),score=110.78 gnl/Spiro4/21341_TR10421_c0_g4_i1:56-1717(-)
MYDCTVSPHYFGGEESEWRDPEHRAGRVPPPPPRPVISSTESFSRTVASPATGGFVMVQLVQPPAEWNNPASWWVLPLDQLRARARDVGLWSGGSKETVCQRLAKYYHENPNSVPPPPPLPRPPAAADDDRHLTPAQQFQKHRAEARTLTQTRQSLLHVRPHPTTALSLVPPVVFDNSRPLETTAPFVSAGRNNPQPLGGVPVNSLLPVRDPYVLDTGVAGAVSMLADSIPSPVEPWTLQTAYHPPLADSGVLAYHHPLVQYKEKVFKAMIADANPEFGKSSYYDGSDTALPGMRRPAFEDEWHTVSDHHSLLREFGLSLDIRIKKFSRKISWVVAYPYGTIPTHARLPKLEKFEVRDVLEKLDRFVLRDYLKLFRDTHAQIASALQKFGRACVQHPVDDQAVPFSHMIYHDSPDKDVLYSLHCMYLNALNQDLWKFVMWWCCRGGMQKSIDCDGCGRPLPQFNTPPLTLAEIRSLNCQRCRAAGCSQCHDPDRLFGLASATADSAPPQPLVLPNREEWQLKIDRLILRKASGSTANVANTWQRSKSGVGRFE